MWSFWSTVVSAGRIMSAAVAGAATLACSDISSTCLFAGIRALGASLGTEMSAAPGCPSLRYSSASQTVWSRSGLGLEWGTGQARRNDLDAVGIAASDRLPGFGSSVPGGLLADGPGTPGDFTTPVGRPGRACTYGM